MQMDGEKKGNKKKKSQKARLKKERVDQVLSDRKFLDKAKDVATLLNEIVLLEEKKVAKSVRRYKNTVENIEPRFVDCHFKQTYESCVAASYAIAMNYFFGTSIQVFFYGN